MGISPNHTAYNDPVMRAELESQLCGVDEYLYSLPVQPGAPGNIEMLDSTWFERGLYRLEREIRKAAKNNESIDDASADPQRADVKTLTDALEEFEAAGQRSSGNIAQR